jgi:hypothetical protein
LSGTDSTPQEWTVQTVAGETLRVQTESEQRWFNDSRTTYLSQTKFSETTDLRDLDRLLFMELMIFRLSHFLAQGSDYDGFEVDDALLRRNVREYSEQITRVKSSMGLTKQARDEAAHDGDLSAYITNLKAKAKIFGLHREAQLTKALVLMNELSAIVEAYDRSDAEERKKLGFETPEEIIDWVRHTMLPEYRALDEHFRKNDQRYWIRTM